MMNSRIFCRWSLFFLFGFVLNAFGQNRPSSEQFSAAGLPAVVQRALDAIRGGETRPGRGEGIKCGLGPLLEVRDEWNSFSEIERREISRVLAPPVTQKSRTIGHFTIFYDTAGTHAPALLDASQQRIPNTAEAYVDSVGASFETVWAKQIDSLGFDAPPFLPSEQTYDIYIQEEYNNLYGFTMWVNLINEGYPPLLDTYIVIDNDFQGFFSTGMAGLHVTAAHEFHHAIQLGRYGYWSTDRYFLEITSTWMEDVVYDDVNDYYQYLSNSTAQISQFSYPSVTFTKADYSIEYSRAIWGKYLEEKYSPAIMRSVWNYIRQMNALPALDRALSDAGSSFREAFLEWGLWNMNTGVYADTSAHCYREAQAYPMMRMNAVTDFTSGQRTINGSTEVMSSSYYPLFVHRSVAETLRVNVLITNVNMTQLSQPQSFSYIVADQGDESFRHLSIGLFVKLNVPDNVNWLSQELVVDTGGVKQITELVSDVVVYPNPFRSNGTNRLNFRLPAVSSSEATLTIMNTGFDRVFSKEHQLLNSVLEWDGSDERGEKAPSGIYFYVIDAGDTQFVGKFAIVRD